MSEKAVFESYIYRGKFFVPAPNSTTTTHGKLPRLGCVDQSSSSMGTQLIVKTPKISCQKSGF